ncbi:acyl-ACP--UDP-N-acetylglucosamine O-acyltransferase [Puniceicoccaceae bacterium]|nr:acyl-ACP--UDP-N-acetylglucosamine O-acyltransferase [Puniceicoccaceae bacterium]
MSMHDQAIVDPAAQIGEGTCIAVGAIVEAGATIGRNCQIAAYAIIRKGVTLGDSVRVDSFAVIGGEPQSIGFDPSTESYSEIGDRTIIRESVTIHRGSAAGSKTVVGADCFIMANAHVAHDCELASGVVLANNVMIAGHIRVGEKTFIGGGAGIHQFCRIGAYCMIAGNATITADVPHFVVAAKRNEAHGLNLIGLKRGGFERDTIKDLKLCYRAVLFAGGNLKRKALEAANGSACGSTLAGARFLNFFEEGQRGFIQSTRD